jgi:hypothetical protein
LGREPNVSTPTLRRHPPPKWGASVFGGVLLVAVQLQFSEGSRTLPPEAVPVGVGSGPPSAAVRAAEVDDDDDWLDGRDRLKIGYGEGCGCELRTPNSEQGRKQQRRSPIKLRTPNSTENAQIKLRTISALRAPHKLRSSATTYGIFIYIYIHYTLLRECVS